MTPSGYTYPRCLAHRRESAGWKGGQRTAAEDLATCLEDGCDEPRAVTSSGAAKYTRCEGHRTVKTGVSQPRRKWTRTARTLDVLEPELRRHNRRGGVPCSECGAPSLALTPVRSRDWQGRVCGSCLTEYRELGVDLEVLPDEELAVASA